MLCDIGARPGSKIDYRYVHWTHNADAAYYIPFIGLAGLSLYSLLFVLFAGQTVPIHTRSPLTASDILPCGTDFLDESLPRRNAR